MKIENINKHHLESIIELAIVMYQEEQEHVNIIPKKDYYNLFYNMLKDLINPELGVVAIEGKNVVGFITCYNPINNFLFGSLKGVFSPIYANAAIKNNRKKIYTAMYHIIANKWVNQKIFCHAIGIYAHNKESIKSLFFNGFGLRTIDAIRKVEPFKIEKKLDCKFYELPLEKIDLVFNLKNNLRKHMNDSPLFMKTPQMDNIEEFHKQNKNRISRYFVADINSEIVGFIEIRKSGENYICNIDNMINICGAYILKKYRGKGIFENLHRYLLNTLSKENYKLCGVDFESVNITAQGFWLKYYKPYTYGLLRIIGI